MTLVGCDLHTRKQQVAVLDTDTGEVLDQELAHWGDAVERFYARLPEPVTVGIEARAILSGSMLSCSASGITLLVGEAAKIRAMVVRKTKTDRRDARHLLDLSKHDRFPMVWMPDPAHPGYARPRHSPCSARPHPHDDQEWPSRHRAQPAPCARPLVVDQARSGPAPGPGAAAPYDPPPRGQSRVARMAQAPH